jgi:Fe2+ transport system protein FeoA
LAERVIEGDIEPQVRYRLMSFGMVSDKAKAELVRMERLPLPVELLGDEAKVTILASMLASAEEVRKTLWGALYRLAEQLIAFTADLQDGRKPAPADAKKLLAHWNVEPIFWQQLENPFLRSMGDLAEGGDPQIIVSNWQSVLFSTARSTLDKAISMAGETPQALKAAVLARGQLGGGLKKLTPTS